MTTNTDPISGYWLDQATAEIVERFPTGKILVSSGISPSASYHIGHFREILTAEALAWGIRRSGREADHIHVVDNFDPLRKRYDFLPEKFEEFVGRPICLIPDPFDCHKTYAEHYYSEFEDNAIKMGIRPSKVVRGYEDLYKSGKMVQPIEQVLENIDVVREVFEKMSNRQLDADWTPVMVLDDQDHFSNASLASWDKAAQTISGVSYVAGRAKLNWRLDWPGRWSVLGVQVEPFSHQEHGAAGGSYDTGVEFSKKVFGYEPPVPGVQYGNIHLVGDTKKMSSSKGNLITPEQALSIMPPEVLRYFVVKSKPERTLYFDPGLGLYNLIDEYAKVETAITKHEETEFAEAYQFASDIKEIDVLVSGVSFNHLVVSYQAAHGDSEKVLGILARSGWTPTDDTERTALLHELSYVAKWLEKYAPESITFTIQKELPHHELNDGQKYFLLKLVTMLGDTSFEAQAIHDAVYEASVSSEIKPAEAFRTIYQLFLGKDSGPKVGFFLSNLEKDFVIARLKLEA